MNTYYYINYSKILSKARINSKCLDLAIKSDKEALANHSSSPPIPTEEIIEIIIYPLSESTFFQYDGNFCQQIHGTSMGSEEKTLASYPNPPSFWYRYVDET